MEVIDTSKQCLAVMSPSLNSHVVYTDCQQNDQKQVRIGVELEYESIARLEQGNYDLL